MWGRFRWHISKIYKTIFDMILVYVPNIYTLEPVVCWYLLIANYRSAVLTPQNWTKNNMAAAWLTRNELTKLAMTFTTNRQFYPGIWGITNFNQKFTDNWHYILWFCGLPLKLKINLIISQSSFCGWRKTSTLNISAEGKYLNLKAI